MSQKSKGDIYNIEGVRLLPLSSPSWQEIAILNQRAWWEGASYNNISLLSSYEGNIFDLLFFSTNQSYLSRLLRDWKIVVPLPRNGNKKDGLLVFSCSMGKILLHFFKMVLKPVPVLITSLLSIDTAYTRCSRGAWLWRRWSWTADLKWWEV